LKNNSPVGDQLSLRSLKPFLPVGAMNLCTIEYLRLRV
jgi:hypothetical protein